jgi:hypothetical protein
MRALTTTLLLLALCPGAHAGVLYKFRDESGTLHFVDSADAIPERYRPQTTMEKREAVPPSPEESKETSASRNTPTGTPGQQTPGRHVTSARPPAHNRPPASLCTGNPCGAKRYCATIYVAPWCPYCHKAEGWIKDVLSRNNLQSDGGVRVVVGAGRMPADNLRYASTFGPCAQNDDTKSIAKKLDVHAFPTYYVQDGDEVILRGNAALQWIQRRF